MPSATADAALRIMDRATSLSEDKRAVNLPKIYVPIDLIIVDLMWQDVENGEYPKKRRRESG